MYNLYTWQQPHAQRLLELLRRGDKCVIDASDTGTGKTIVALWALKQLNKPVLVLAPKAVLGQWSARAGEMQVPLLGAFNPERLKTGKTPWMQKFNRGVFQWKLPPGTIVVFDEAQQYGGESSDNGRILALMKGVNAQALTLSATLASSPLRMRSLGYLLDWFPFQDYRRWCLQNGCFPSRFGQGYALDFPKGKARLGHLTRIHGQLFPAHGSRIRIAEVPDFPENQVYMESYDLGEYTAEIDKLYDAAVLKSKQAEKHLNPLVDLLRAREFSETCKLPLLRDLTQEALEEGHSIVVFFNFRHPLREFRRYEFTDEMGQLAQFVEIHGDQNADERAAARNAFVSDQARVCLCMIQAGGVGLDLNDQHGRHPRTVLINPPISAEQFRQALGRAARANNKSKALQYVVFAAGTVEERVCHLVRTKLANISTLNDGDLAGMEI